LREATDASGPACPYDSNGRKYCLDHHPHFDVFRARIQAAATFDTAASELNVAADASQSKPPSRKRIKNGKRQKMSDEEKKAERGNKRHGPNPYQLRLSP
jgi:hypothetical protein